VAQLYPWALGSLSIIKKSTQRYKVVRTSQETHYVSATSPTGIKLVSVSGHQPVGFVAGVRRQRLALSIGLN
jgi:hypothetical protein